jgi:drug/metabolite transporter (DMT)-like permease
VNRTQVSPRWVLLPAVTAVATASLFIRLASVPPVAAAFWRAAVAGSVFLFSFAIPTVRRQWQALPLKTVLAVGAATFIIALHNILFISSLAYTSVAAAVVLTSTQPIFTAFFGRLFIHERVSSRSVVGLVGAMTGIAILSLSKGGQTTLKGNLLAIAAAITVAAFALCARRLRQHTPIVPFMFTVHVASVIYLFLFAALFAVPLSGFSVPSWRALLLLGLVPTLIGHTLLNYSIGYLKAYLVGLAIIGEPVGATILAALFLGEIPSLQTAIGGVLIIASILFAISEKEAIPAMIAD